MDVGGCNLWMLVVMTRGGLGWEDRIELSGSGFIEMFFDRLCFLGGCQCTSLGYGTAPSIAGRASRLVGCCGPPSGGSTLSPYRAQDRMILRQGALPLHEIEAAAATRFPG